MIITFTCPHCGGHQLQQIRQAIHRSEVKLTTANNGELQATPLGVVEELRGPVLGYRCKNCRYPDIKNHEEKGGFYWGSPAEVHQAGCITIAEQGSTPHRCMICHKDGRMEPLLVESNQGGTLSSAQRIKILARRGNKGAVLICESDPGIAAFSSIDWHGIDSERV